MELRRWLLREWISEARKIRRCGNALSEDKRAEKARNGICTIPASLLEKTEFGDEFGATVVSAESSHQGGDCELWCAIWAEY